MSTSLTRGIKVEVETRYLLERSTPADGEYAFAYTIRITNEGSAPAQLRSRHWIITDGHGKVCRRCAADGVVGAQPHLRPGQAFGSTRAGACWPTPHGSMEGSYQMVCDNGERFDALIAPFPLAPPFSLN